VVDTHVAHGAAHLAHEVMMRIGVGVESGGAGAQVELQDLVEFRELGEHRVDGPQRDRRHGSVDRLIHPFSAGVQGIVVQRLEDGHPLGSDPEAVGAEHLGQTGGGLHGGNLPRVTTNLQELLINN